MWGLTRTMLMLGVNGADSSLSRHLQAPTLAWCLSLRYTRQATSYMLHAGPDPSHVLYFTVYMILALGQLLQVLSYSLQYPAPCRIVWCIPRLGLRRMKNTHHLIEKVFVYIQLRV